MFHYFITVCRLVTYTYELVGACQRLVSGFKSK